MKQNNIFNRIFCKKILQEEKNKYEKCKSLVGHYSDINKRICEAKDLRTLLDLHKKAWNLGYRNANLGPCEYGMFRTKDIACMNPEEVFLGDIYGLWTFPIPKWEENKDEKFSDDKTIYDIVLEQYKKILRLNIESLYKESINVVKDYEKVNPPKNPYKLKISC